MGTAPMILNSLKSEQMKIQRNCVFCREDKSGHSEHNKKANGDFGSCMSKNFDDKGQNEVMQKVYEELLGSIDG